MAEERLGRYRLVAEHGFGAMGIVYLAEPDGTDAAPVAVKVLRPGLATSAGIRERFLREAVDCRSEKPALREIGPSHFVACHFAEQVPARPTAPCA